MPPWQVPPSAPPTQVLLASKLFSVNYIFCEVYTTHSTIPVLHVTAEHFSRSVILQVCSCLNFAHLKCFAKTALQSNTELVENSFSCFFMWKYQWRWQIGTDLEIPPRPKMNWAIKAGAQPSSTGSRSEHLPVFGSTRYEFPASVRRSRTTADFLIRYMNALLQTSFLLFYCRKKLWED